LEFALITFLNGLSYGFLLFMLSSGLTLIYSMMGVPNFAHASFYMLGAYAAYAISSVLGFWPALVLAPLLIGALGALIEHYGLRIVHRYGHIPELLFTFGLSYMVVEVVQLIWGRPGAIPDSAGTGRYFVYLVFHYLPGVSRLHAAGRGLHAGGDLRTVAAYPHRSHDSGRADASADG